MKSVTTFIVIVVTTLFCTSQDLRLRRVGLEQGLPSTFVTQILQDDAGYLWIGTQDGLAKFDGITMQVYRHRQGDPTALPSSNVFAMHLDARRRLCIGTGGGYCVATSSDGVWSAVEMGLFPKPSQPSRVSYPFNGDVNVEFTARNGHRWIGTVARGLLELDESGRLTATYNLSQPKARRLTSNDVWAIHEDRNGGIWVGTNGGGVSIIRNGSISATLQHDPRDPTTLSSNVVRTFCEDNNGSMWIGTFGGGLSQYDPFANMIPRIAPSNLGLGFADDAVRGITQAADGWVYVGVKTGVFRCREDLSNSELVAQWHSRYDKVGSARALFVDRRGTLWIGTERNGLGFVVQGSHDVVWLRGKEWTAQPFSETISSITLVAPDTLAIGTDGGIALVNISTRRPTWYDVPPTPAFRQPRRAISAIQRIQGNMFLIGTEQGLLKGPLGGPYTFIQCPDPKAAQPNCSIIRSIALRNNIAYVGTWNAGVRIINLATMQEEVVDRRKGLPSDMAYTAIPLPNNRLVITSNNGVLIWNLTTRKLERVIGPNEGAQSLEFNSWSWHATTSGIVYAGGVGGVNRIDPFRLVSAPPPTIVGVRVRQESNEASSRTLTITSIALSNTLPLEYGVQLTGATTSWITTPNRELHFPSLAPGEYDVAVMARYTGGGWGKPWNLRIRIEPPIWQTWWSYLTAVVVLSSVVWGSATVVARRREQIKKEREQLLHEERLRIAKDLHDDVGTGLAKIVILSENALADDSTNDVSRSVAETAREVIDSVRSIVWVMKSADDSLVAAIGYVRDKISELFTDKSIGFSYEQHIPDDVALNLVVRRNIVLALKECATNIVRHSKARNVRMKVSVEHEHLRIEIRDDGVGFDTKKPLYGAGLANMRERMHEIGGELTLESKPGMGTSTRMDIPIGRKSHYSTL